MNVIASTRDRKKRKRKVPSFDAELIFIECALCGRPLNWARGETTRYVRKAGIDPESLDSTYLIVSLGCSSCEPEEFSFVTHLVQLGREKGEAPS